MRKQLYLSWILIVIVVLAACTPFSQQPEAEPIHERLPSSESTLLATEPVKLSCLSPSFEMNAARAAHSATRLSDGHVLIAGGFRQEGTSEIAIASAEIFDPLTNTFMPTKDMNEPRNGQTATLLPDGQVLLVGGWNQSGRTSTAELYDPQTGTFEYTGSMMAPRQGMTATLLKNGWVLIAGGDSARNTPQPVAELYDPSTKTFAPAGNLNNGRIGHTTTLLTDGKLLLVGGSPGNGTILASAEIYDPETRQFTLTNDANIVRYKHTAVLLKDGTVLILGGADHRDSRGQYSSAEIYDVQSGAFTEISNMNFERFKLPEAAVLLGDGNVLIGGGNRHLEIFDAKRQTFTPADTLDNDYYFSVLTLLNNGQVLITGGYDANITPSNKAWLYCV